MYLGEKLFFKKNIKMVHKTESDQSDRHEAH